MSETDITIGKIVGTYGRMGLLKVYPLTDFPDRFLSMDRVTLELYDKKKVYTIDEARPYRGHILIKFAEVADMTEAETLRGALLKVSRADLVDLPVGSYYIFDIIGLQVFTGDGALVGKVEDVIQTGANDVYVVGTGEGNKPVLVPALKEIVREVDIKGGKMVVDLTRIQEPGVSSQ